MFCGPCCLCSIVIDVPWVDTTLTPLVLCAANIVAGMLTLSFAHARSHTPHRHTGQVDALEKQLRGAKQAKQEAELQLHYATEEAQELRAAKEAAVFEKEQVAVRSERRSQAHEVRQEEQQPRWSLQHSASTTSLD